MPAAATRAFELSGPETSRSEVVEHRLVADLHAPRRLVFWADMIGSAGVGWIALLAASAAVTFSAAQAGLILVAALALYRALCFTHELTHLGRGAVPGFETAWNLVVGVPLLLPSFTYVGVHQSHHHLATYGTAADPEYLPFARSRLRIVVFALNASLLIPPALLLRFLVLAPVGLVWPAFHRWLETRASSFSMNPAYRRVVAAPAVNQMRRWESVTLAMWAGAILLAWSGNLPVAFFSVWVVTLVVVSFLNTLRVLGAHEYDSDGRPLSREGQLRDSIDTPGGPWTELWAPVGLRYHALHHYFPGIPYHNLPAAYRRIVQSVPNSSVYHESTSPSLGRSLLRLWRRATARARHACRTSE